MDVCCFEVRLECLRDEEIVDPPADITCPGICPVGPPSVGFGFVGIKMSECIDEATGEHLVESFALFLGEAMLADVWLGICKVDFLVSDVQITTKDHWFGLLELLDVFEECFVPLIIAHAQAR